MSISIGELSQQARIKVPTIRYYERNGLLPIASRTQMGHRSYNASDVARLRFIHFGRSLGFEGAEIRAVLEMATEGNSEELDVMAQFVRERIGALTNFSERISAISRSIRNGELDQAEVLSRLGSLAENDAGAASNIAAGSESTSQPAIPSAKNRKPSNS